MESKLFRMAIKDIDEAEGTFRGYLSVFNIVDHGGDLIKPGAFRKTLRQTRAFPLLWAHSSQDPSHVIGTFHGQEDNYGLLILGEFFTDQAGGKEAYEVVKKLKEKGVKVGLSIGYKADKWTMEESEDKHTIRVLKEIQLFEGSMTLFPMNEAAVVQAVKDTNTETKPSETNHVCVIGGGDYVRYRGEKRSHEGKPYTVRYGITKDGTAEEYEYFYPAAKWTSAEAKAHCKSHKGKRFEAATGKGLDFECPACGETTTITIEEPELDDKAFEDREPDKESILDNEPPADEVDDAQVSDFLKHLVEVSK